MDDPSIWAEVGWLGFPHARIGIGCFHLERILKGRRLL